MLEHGVQSGRVQVTPSAVAELMNVFYGLGRASATPKPWHDYLVSNRQDLVQRVRSLSVPESSLVPRGYELFWIAAYTGYITSLDPEPFFQRFPQLVQRTWRDWTESSRSGDVPDEITEARTQFLQTLLEPAAQAEYVAVLRELWREVGPQWEQDGLPVVQVECSRLNQRLHEGAQILELLPPTHFLQFEEYAHHFSEDPGRGLVITPLHFSHGGYLIDIDMDKPLYIGYSPLNEGMHHATVQKATELAAKLKAFSDATRLTLLSTICELDVTVGDLAKLLNITQPSVSGHLRLLERAGLVTVKRKGAKAFYRADAVAIKALLKEANDLLT